MCGWCCLVSLGIHFKKKLRFYLYDLQILWNRPSAIVVPTFESRLLLFKKISFLCDCYYVGLVGFMYDCDANVSTTARHRMKKIVSYQYVFIGFVVLLTLCLNAFYIFLNMLCYRKRFTYRKEMWSVMLTLLFVCFKCIFEKVNLVKKNREI